MRFELMQLANEIPVTFGQITEIATIGNQLGIAQGDLVNFTETVAKFSATTDVTVQNAAMSFGRIGELLNVSDFNALGSAIAFAGVNAVATETQILAVTKEIATTAKQAKFTAAETIGLATALGSLGIAPEAARGSIIRSFAAINAAISAGGANLQAYANIAGMTAEQFASTWQDNGARAFDALLKGLQAASDDGQNLDTVLRGLGVRNVRDIQTLQKLGDNYDVYAQSIKDANQAFEEGSFLSQSYGVIQETVSAKLGVLQNQINNLLAGLGESTTGPVKIALDLIGALLTALQEFSRNPAGKFITGLVVGLAALAAAVATVNTVVALARASMLAYATAMGTAKIAADGTVTGLYKMATAARIASVALKSIGIGLAISGVVATVSMLGDEIQRATDKAGFLQRKAEELAGGFGGLQEALAADYLAAIGEYGTDAAVGIALANGELEGQVIALNSNNEAARNAAEIQAGFAVIAGTDMPEALEAGTDAIAEQNVVLGENFDAWMRSKIVSSETFQQIAQNKDVIGFLKQVEFSFEDALSAAKAGNVEAYFESIKKRAKELGILLPEYLDINNLFAGIQFPLEDLQNLLGGSAGYAFLLGRNTKDAAAATEDASGAAGELEKSMSGASRAIRTVLDHANDLRGILERVADIKLNRQLVKDDIADGWDEIAEKATDAEEAIRSANAEIQELTADRGVVEYQLAVAQRYGDEKRAAVLRARLAKIDDRMAKAQGDLSEAQEDSNKSLKGNTKAARENRDALAGMVDRYQDYIVALVESGLKGKALEDAVAALKRQFEAQAKAVGFADDELKPYLETFDNFKEVVEKMPRNVDVQFNSNISAAMQALREYELKLNSLNGRNITTTTTNKEQTIVTSPPYPVVIKMEDAIRIRRAYDQGLVSYRDFMRSVYGFTATGGSGVMMRAQGGPVFGPGSATSDSIPAMLSNGEFVMKAKAVRAYGLDFMNSINQMKPIGSMGGVGGGATAIGGVTIAQLSPEDRALLRAAVDRPINLYADSKKIAQTANDGNNLIARRGVR
jgi:TP901 family phage tail tape measure protein